MTVRGPIGSMALATVVALLQLGLGLAPWAAGASPAINVDLHRGDPDPQNAGTPSSSYGAA